LEASVFIWGSKLKKYWSQMADSYITVEPYLLRNQITKWNMETLSKSCNFAFLLLM